MPFAGIVTDAHCFRVTVHPQFATRWRLCGELREIGSWACLNYATIVRLKEQSGIIAVRVETDLPWLQIGVSRTLTKQTGTLEDDFCGSHS